MKLKVLRSALNEGLKSVQNIVAGKGSLPILQNVLLEASGEELKMVTTDLDISIRTSCVCKVDENGSTTLPVRLLSSAMSKVQEGEVEIEVDEKNRATISAGNARYKLAGLSEQEFPKLPSDDASYAYSLNQKTLKDMLRKVSYAASQDDTRRALKGVMIGFRDSKVTMVATDGRRLALFESELEFPKDAERDIVIPSKVVVELQRSLGEEGEVKLMVQKSQVCFDLGGVVIYSKLIDDVYPNYLQVIPKSTVEHISIDRQLLLDALERASVMTMDEAHSTKLIFENGKLTVTSAASDIGEARDVVPIKYAGEKIEILFNPSFVMDPLKAIDDDEVMINLNDGHSPAVIKCNSPFLYVLMPLRIS